MKLEVGGQKLEVRSRKSVISYLALGVFILGTLAACSEEKETLDTPDNYDYFPLEIGKYWVYEVDSTIFINQTRRDSSTTLIKEQIVDYVIDNAGDTIYRVDQYERKDSTQAWQIRRVISLSRNEKQAVRTEDNISLIKLVFPLHRRGTWSSTAFISPTSLQITVAGSELYPFSYWGSNAKIERIDEPLMLGRFQFSATATVTYTERDDITTAYRFAQEVYAKGIGLVKKDWQILNDSNCSTSECMAIAWEKRAENGFIIQQRLVDHN